MVEEVELMTKGYRGDLGMAAPTTPRQGLKEKENPSSLSNKMSTQVRFANIFRCKMRCVIIKLSHVLTICSTFSAA